MSLLFEKLAQAGASARELMVGRQAWCRGCERGGDPNSDGHGAVPFVLLDIDQPTGICRGCAERFGWHRFFLSSPDFIDGEAQAA